MNRLVHEELLGDHNQVHNGTAVQVGLVLGVSPAELAFRMSLML